MLLFSYLVTAMTQVSNTGIPQLFLEDMSHELTWQAHELGSPDFLPATEMNCHTETASLGGGCFSSVKSTGDRTQAEHLAAAPEETRARTTWPLTRKDVA